MPLYNPPCTQVQASALMLLSTCSTLGPLAQIRVPGNWECHGHGTPIYSNYVYPIPVSPPRTPASNPTGVYRHCFDVTEHDPSCRHARDCHPGGAQILHPTACIECCYGCRYCCRYFLELGGADSAALLWLNGTWVGAAKDSRLASEFEVTRLLRPTGNLLVVQVVRWSDATYLEDQDMWRLR